MRLNFITTLRASFQRVINEGKNPLESRRITIAINLAFIQAILCLIFYLVMRIITRDFQSSLTPILFFITFLVLFLVLKGKYRVARTIDLISLDILLFLISQRMGNQAGVDFYFVAAGSSALVLFGYEEWRTGVLFALLSLVFFILSEIVVLEFIPIRELTTEQKNYFTICNAIFTFLISTYCIVMIMKLNYESEKMMVEKQFLIEKQNTELQKTNEELDRFVYSASHDLRAPLSTISGMINLMEMEKSNYDSQYLKHIKNRVKAMDGFIGDIVEYSRNTRLAPECKEFNLFDLTNTIIDSLKYFENSHDVNFVVNMASDFKIHSDEDRIKVVLNNIFVNSIKYADQNKKNRYIEVNAFHENGASVIEIKDNGIGIDENHQARVFDMFYRATEKSKGSGLGLYITKEVIEKLKGKINVQSRAKEGTTFNIELPNT